MTQAASWPRASIMARLTPEERRDLLAAGTGVRFARGDMLVRQGDPGTALFALTSGWVKVVMTADSGSEVILALRGRGDLVGEFAVIDEEPRIASVAALGAVAAARIGRGRFLEFCDRHPAAYPKVMRYLTNKIRRASDQRAAARALEPHARIARVLYEMATEHGAPAADGIVVPPLTQADMAAFAAVGASTAERALREFRDEGIVLSRYRSTVVLDMAALRARAGTGT